MSINKKTNRKIVEGLYSVNQVSQGFYYYLGMLLDIAVDIFEYEGLPDTLPQEEIEKRLITSGHCAIVKHPKYGLIAVDSTLFNRDLYGRYERINTYNPFKGFLLGGYLPGNKVIGEQCEVIYNSSVERWVDMPGLMSNNFWQTIQRYARVLADIDSTIHSEMVQLRTPYVMIATSQQNKESALSLIKSVQAGETEVAIDEFFIKNLTALKIKDVVPNSLNELIETKNSILKQFLADIGIYSTDDKKERLIVDEVQQENQNVKVFIYSMLKARMKGIEKVNALYGLNIKVGLRKELYDESELYEEGDEIDESEGLLTE